MSNADRLAQLARVLEQMGHTHSVEDIVAMCESGAMQSFANGETWVVTQVLDFPRKRALDIVMVVGTLEEFRGLYNRILEHAEREGCTLLRAFARTGWTPYLRANDWSGGVQVWTKNLKGD